MLLIARTLRHLAGRAGARLRREEGFTMVAVSGVMIVATLAAFAAISAADGDIPQARSDEDRKEAYAAAEAGLNWYMFHLERDNEYFTRCDSVGAPVYQEGELPELPPLPVPGVSPPGSVPDSEARYAIELLPAPGYTECVENLSQSMVDSANGTFGIRVTGYSGSGEGAVKRSIVSKVRRRGFLDFMYFTDIETTDPLWFTTDPATSTTCSRWKRSGRPSFPCQDIRFASQDEIRGPLHTNDQLLICGTPTFGRTADDKIEISAPTAPGWTGSGSCSGNNPNFVGSPQVGAPVLALPPSNTSLSTIAEPDYRFTGRTQITLEGTSMRVTNAARGLTNSSMDLPENGVIWVGNGTCPTTAYNTTNPSNTPTGCADVYLRGNYSEDLTIASQKDIIIAPPGAPGTVSGTPPNGDVVRNGNAILGLVAGNFVRIYHPVDVDNDGDDGDGDENDNDCSASTRNGNGAMTGGVRVDAAILTLLHSFIVDNYRCGPPLGTLTINGAIAQKFRGPVGTGGGGSITTGYAKSYNYDDRLRYRSPPFFLDPVQSPWRQSRVNEQVPAP